MTINKHDKDDYINSILAEEDKANTLQTLPIDSVSDVTANQINQTKTELQNNSNSNKSVNQNITNHIAVTTTDGILDKEDFIRQVAEAQKEIAHDEQDLQFADVS